MDIEREALFKLAYLVEGFLGSESEGNQGDAKDWKRHMRNWMDENDWLQWQQAARQAPASGEVEPVGIIELSDYVQLGDDAPIPRRKALAETTEGSIQNLPAGTELFTHPPAKVPEALWEALADCVSCFNCPEWSDKCEEVERRATKLLNSTTPTPATTPETEWVKCAQTLPAKDHPFQCWYCPVPDSKSPNVVLTSARAVRNMFSTGNAPDARWMCSGINVPTPPQEQ